MKYYLKSDLRGSVSSLSGPCVSIRDGDIKDHGGVTWTIVDVACGGVNEEDLAIRPNTVTFK